MYYMYILLQILKSYFQSEFLKKIGKGANIMSPLKAHILQCACACACWSPCLRCRHLCVWTSGQRSQTRCVRMEVDHWWFYLIPGPECAKFNIYQRITRIICSLEPFFSSRSKTQERTKCSSEEEGEKKKSLYGFQRRNSLLGEWMRVVFFVVCLFHELTGGWRDVDLNTRLWTPIREYLFIRKSVLCQKDELIHPERWKTRELWNTEFKHMKLETPFLQFTWRQICKISNFREQTQDCHETCFVERAPDVNLCETLLTEQSVVSSSEELGRLLWIYFSPDVSSQSDHVTDHIPAPSDNRPHGARTHSCGKRELPLLCQRKHCKCRFHSTHLTARFPSELQLLVFPSAVVWSNSPGETLHPVPPNNTRLHVSVAGGRRYGAGAHERGGVFRVWKVPDRVPLQPRLSGLQPRGRRSGEVQHSRHGLQR